MELGLEGRVAFVAGASSGLGFASAVQLAAEGCHVAICSRSRSRVEAAADRIRAGAGYDVRVMPLECDVTDEAQIRAAIDATVSAFGGLHVLVTNAGGPPSGYVADFDATDWREALELNLISTINITRHALPHLSLAAAQDRHARIIMIASVSAKQPIPNLYLSNVSRAGVIGFAKSLSEEVGAQGITVNSLLPGFTRTDRLGELARSINEKTGRSIADVETGWADATALKRLGEPEEFGATLAFLASRQAAFITGVALPVDGGRVKHLL